MKRGRGRVHINSNSIYTVFHDSIETLFKFALVDIMLILTDSDGFWIDLTSSANGSWNLLAMLTAPLTVVSLSGNSRRAISEAE